MADFILGYFPCSLREQVRAVARTDACARGEGAGKQAGELANRQVSLPLAGI
jgi:hypothetical protein